LHWISYFLDSITSSLPSWEGTCSLSHTAHVILHTWLLVVEPDPVYKLYQLSLVSIPTWAILLFLSLAMYMVT